MTIERYHYQGLGRSEEAVRAEARGALPASRAARALGLRSASMVSLMFPEVGVFKVGKFGMHVRYYDVSDNALRTILLNNRNDGETTLAGSALRICEATADAFTKAGHRRFASRLWDIVRADDGRKKAA